MRPDITSIILGPPGTGKTHRLLNTVEECLKSTPPNEIIYLAFTRKAATEAASRAAERFNLTPDQLPWFRTIHSLAFHQLGWRKDRMMAARDYVEIARELGLFLTLKAVSPDGTFHAQSRGDRMMHMIAMSRAMMMRLSEYWAMNPDEDIQWEDLDLLDRTIKAHKQEAGKRDFADLLDMYYEEATVPPHQYLFVDEAQDLSRHQWIVIEKIAKETGKRIYVAGDDDQAIFRWAGADVNRLIELPGQITVLNQSRRVPVSVAMIAEKVVERIEHRVEKQWHPTTDEGEVIHVTDVDQIDMGEGAWMLLARNVYLLERFSQHCVQMGYPFDSQGPSPVRSGLLGPIVAWENLRKGRKVRASECKQIYDLISKKVKYGYKRVMDNADDNLMLSMEDLHQRYGLETDLLWHTALDRIPEEEREYFIAALRRGEKLLKEPRIKISTIHGVKGGEAENVVLMTDMATRTHREFQDNPDDEHRVWYVGITRAKRRLYIMQPQTNKYYEI